MTNRNHKKLIATLPKLKLVIIRMTEIMEEETDRVEHQPETIDADELEIIQDNIAALDDQIGTLTGILDYINESFQLA